MGIESFDYTDFAFYGCSTYVAVFSFGLLFKAPLEEYIGCYKEIKLPASAERTFKIRCLAQRMQDCFIFSINFKMCKSLDRVQIETLNVREANKKSEEIPGKNCENSHRFAKIMITDNKDNNNDSGQSIFFQFCCYTSRTIEINKTLDDLMRSELFSDVTIVSSDGKHFNVHKNIIACKNEVFRAHLTHDTEENKTGKISSPFEAEVLEELLRYIYLEHVNNLDSLSARLFIAADYYKVEDLKAMCELDLYRRLTVDNALEMYKLAYLHSATHLKTYCQWFIGINRRKISESTAWTEFEPSALMKDLLHSFLVM